jgi:hypothetical protein
VSSSSFASDVTHAPSPTTAWTYKGVAARNGYTTYGDNTGNIGEQRIVVRPRSASAAVRRVCVQANTYPRDDSDVAAAADVTSAVVFTTVGRGASGGANVRSNYANGGELRELGLLRGRVRELQAAQTNQHTMSQQAHAFSNAAAAANIDAALLRSERDAATTENAQLKTEKKRMLSEIATLEAAFAGVKAELTRTQMAAAKAVRMSGTLNHAGRFYQ